MAIRGMMTEQHDRPVPVITPAEQKRQAQDERLAEALRQNLRRRKLQSRARAAADEPSD
jgi:hypothetical protein